MRKYYLQESEWQELEEDAGLVLSPSTLNRTSKIARIAE